MLSLVESEVPVEPPKDTEKAGGNTRGLELRRHL